MTDDLPTTSSGSDPLQDVPQPTKMNQVGTSPTGGAEKEKEPFNTTSEVQQIEQILSDVELAPELTEVGVEQKNDVVSIPPEALKMGVQGVGPSQPITTQAVGVTVSLPLSDDQIMIGIHANILSSIRWLAQWCTRQLKKFHFHLKRVGGKVTREQE